MAIGGNIAKFLQLDDTEVEHPPEGFEEKHLRIVVNNPHLVVIGEIVVEIVDQSVWITSKNVSDGEVEFMYRAG